MTALMRPFSSPGAKVDFKLVRGQGSDVFDSSGKRYLNATSGLWNLSFGLGSEQIIQAMHRQLKLLAYTGLFDGTHSLAEALAERLVSLSEGRMHCAYLSTTGTSAIEVAIRISRLHHSVCGRSQQRVILGLDLGYHGCSLMGLSVGGIGRVDLGKEEILPDFEVLPSPDREAASLEAIATRVRVGDVAALVIEPVLGSGGVIIPSRNYCNQLNNLCRKYGVLIIADEVATGGGRCGQMFASPLVGLEPDVITLSKGLNSGYYPTSATLFSDFVVAPLRACNSVFQYGSTQDGNPVGCAATLATLDMLASGEVFTRVNALGEKIKQALIEMATDTPIQRVRGLGLMIGIDLAHLDDDRTPFTEEESMEVRRLCQEEGLLVYHHRQGISLFPPFTLSDDEADELVDILADLMRRLH